MPRVHQEITYKSEKRLKYEEKKSANSVAAILDLASTNDHTMFWIVPMDSSPPKT